LDSSGLEKESVAGTR